MTFSRKCFGTFVGTFPGTFVGPCSGTFSGTFFGTAESGKVSRRMRREYVLGRVGKEGTRNGVCARVCVWVRGREEHGEGNVRYDRQTFAVRMPCHFCSFVFSAEALCRTVGSDV